MANHMTNIVTKHSYDQHMTKFKNITYDQYITKSHNISTRTFLPMTVIQTPPCLCIIPICWIMNFRQLYSSWSFDAAFSFEDYGWA